ncbi:RHS repeat-associated core domain-containing protein [Agromyces sp. MMS24-K17]|uniref:NHL domain-containing protein n=1 Tax=Agromyces sp. MMS24-K17 TaxID=3372850 RepID=UPI003754D640
MFGIRRAIAAAVASLLASAILIAPALPAAAAAGAAPDPASCSPAADTVTPATTLAAQDLPAKGAGSLTVPPAPPTIAVTAPAGPVTVDAATFTIKGTAPRNTNVLVWADANGNGTRDRTERLVGLTATLGRATTWAVTVKLAQDAVNRFVVTDFNLPWRAAKAVAVPPITESGGVSISQPTATPARFSPTADGVAETVTVAYELSRGANVTATVVTADGVPVRTLANAAPRPAGANAETWDGRRDDGTVAPDGVYTVRLDATAGTTKAMRRTVDATLDATGPVVVVEQPVDGARTADRTLRASAEDGAGVASVSFETTTDGTAWTPAGAADTSAPWTATLPASVVDGAIGIRARAVDAVGVSAVSAVVSATLDTTGPDAPSGLIAADVPDDAGGAIALAWAPSASTDVDAQCVLRAGADGGYDVIAALEPGATTWTDTGLVDGTTYVYAVQAVDDLGHAGARSLAASAIPTDDRDRTAPDTAIATGPAPEVSEGVAAFTFTSTEEGSSFECAVDDADWSACASPLDLSGLGVGDHRFRVRATDPAGNTEAEPAEWTWKVLSAPPGLPQDPTTVATPLDPSVPTDLAEATEFLYTGPNAIQSGVEDGAIEPERAGVVRGRVLDRAGDPLPGVRVHVEGHPEYGHTTSRADGGYDLAVNGGGTLVLGFEKDGHPPVQRAVDPGWSAYAVLDDVVLVPFDEQATEIDFGDPVQVAQSSPVIDEDGTRHATLLFDEGTAAEMVLPNGDVAPLETLHVRSTEFTAGASGPEAMPGALPGMSAYTYAAEFSVDEAVEAGAETVRFSKPVIDYTENFLGFPIGSAVPTGYYDRAEHAWIAGQNGRIVKILRIESGKAVLDVEGKGVAATAAALAALAIDEAELAALADLFPAGTGLWRVALDHFTPWDHNWPFSPPLTSEAPKLPELHEDAEFSCQGEQSGSIIGCDNLTLGERLPVAGTDRTLAYQSERTPGRDNRRVVVPITGATLPTGLVSAELRVEVAGRSSTSTWPNPNPNLVTNATWDGKDAYGREVQGSQVMTISVGYTFKGAYNTPSSGNSSFGSYGATSITGSQTREEVTLWTTQEVVVGHWDARAAGLGGWTLSGQHTYDALARELYRGDGSVVGAENQANVMHPYAGTGSKGFAGDGAPAASAQFNGPQDVASAADGTVYVADTANNRVRRITPAGIVTTIAGTGANVDSGDGGKAISAGLNSPTSVAVAPDGTVLVATTLRVRAIRPDGTITTIAGTGQSGWAGDGGPATAATFKAVKGLAVAADGTVYLADSGACRVRAIGVDGIIRGIAGVVPAAGDNNPRCGFGNDNMKADKAFLANPSDVAIATDGSLLIADTGNNRIRRVGTDGIMRTAASVSGTEQVNSPRSIAVLPDGGYLFTDVFTHRLRKVGTDGTISTVAGTKLTGSTGDGGLAAKAALNTPSAVAVAPDGRLLIADTGNSRFRMIAPPLPDTLRDDVTIASTDGSELYVFESGRHVRTLDAITGATRATIAYDDHGRLESITDGDGDATRVERDAAGHPTAIVAPYGQRTELTVDDHGYLASVTAPGGASTALDSSDAGLLETLTDSRDGVHRFEYVSGGLLHRDEGPDGISTTLERQVTPTGQTVTATSSVGRTTTYEVDLLPGGGMTRTVTTPSGAAATGTIAADGTRTLIEADGTRIVRTVGPDPRFGMSAPRLVTETITTPAGLVHATSISTAATLADPVNPLSLQQLTRTTVVNGRTSTSVIDAPAGTVTDTSPEGRVQVTTFDELGRVTGVDPGGDLLPVSREYDAHGRLARVAQGDRDSTFEYDELGRLVAVTDAAGRVARFGYDDAGRVATVRSPEGAVTTFEHDDAGDVTRIIRPDGREHVFAYSAAGFETSDDPAGEGEWTTAYDADGVPSSRTRPGATTSLGFDDAGRLTSGAEPVGSTSYGYDAASRIATTAADPGDGTAPQSRTYGYDGPLLTSMTASGAVEGSWKFAYDADFTPVGVTFASGQDSAQVAQSYDDDLLLEQTGGFTVTRDEVGAATAMGDGTGATGYGYDAYGDLDALGLTVAGVEAYAAAFAFASDGALAERVEHVAGDAVTTGYAYDDDARLTDVQVDGAVVEHYEYDATGRRTSAEGVGADGTATSVETVYDDADRLVSVGDTAYAYTADGSLAARGDDTFAYGYDGRLVGASVGGAHVAYGYDAEGRRTTRTDAEGTTTYLYGSLASPFRVSAVRGPDGTLTQLTYDEYGHLVSFLRAGARYYVGTDQVGSPRVVTDASGTIVEQVRYSAFGEVLADSAPGFDAPLGFAGGIPDAATGLVRFGMRDYEPATGRWTTRDPIGLSGGQTDLYAYVGQDPVQQRDSSGLADDDMVMEIEVTDEAERSTAADWVAEKAEWLTNLARDWGLNKLKSKLKIGPVKIDPDNASMSLGDSATLKVNGTDAAKFSAECSIAVSPDESTDPFENTDDDMIDLKLKLGASIPLLKKIPLVGKYFGAEEEFSTSINPKEDWFAAPFSSQSRIGRALDAGNIHPVGHTY